MVQAINDVKQVKINIQNSMPLSSNMIHIRKYEDKDIKDYWKYQSEDELYRYLMCKKTKLYRELKKNILNMINLYDVYNITRYIIADRITDKMLGVISMYPVETDDEVEVEIGYWIGKENRHKGIATEALSMVVDMLRDIEGIKSIVVNIMEGNEYSLRIAKNIGFIFENEYKENGKTIYKLSIS